MFWNITAWVEISKSLLSLLCSTTSIGLISKYSISMVKRCKFLCENMNWKIIYLLSIWYSRLVILYSSLIAKIWFTETLLTIPYSVIDSMQIDLLMSKIICNIHTQWFYALKLFNEAEICAYMAQAQLKVPVSWDNFFLLEICKHVLTMLSFYF